MIDLRAQKKKILEEVIDTETYKVFFNFQFYQTRWWRFELKYSHFIFQKAKEILEKFGEPKDIVVSSLSAVPPNLNNSSLVPIKNTSGK